MKIKLWFISLFKPRVIYRCIPCKIVITDIKDCAPDLELISRNAREKALFLLHDKLAREANADLFNAFDIFRRHNLTVTFTINPQLLK